jgi:ABC-type antimicrobial peptide transport system permease subunit
MAPALRALLSEINPDVPISRVQTMREVVANSIAEPRSTMWLLASFALLALVLGAIGIYGVVSYTVTQRRREIGVRVAMGAEPRNIRGLVFGQALRYAAIGLGLGMPAALAVTRVLRSQLFQVGTTDLATYLGGSLVVALVTVAAAWAPASRALRLDAATAIREE